MLRPRRATAPSHSDRRVHGQGCLGESLNEHTTIVVVVVVICWFVFSLRKDSDISSSPDVLW